MGRMQVTFDTGRGYGRTVDVCSGVGGASITQLRGLRTSERPGMPAYAGYSAFAALVA